MVLRFLRALAVEAERRVLAPLYLRELVFRLLQRDHWRMLHLAAPRTTAHQLGTALAHIDAHLHEGLTVAHLAELVGLSTSAFTRSFRELTGTSPYQYVKEARLHRARDLLLDGRHGVAEVGSRVGYASASHFIKEFRRRFGTTPGDFADQRGSRDGTTEMRHHERHEDDEI